MAQRTLRIFHVRISSGLEMRHGNTALDLKLRSIDMARHSPPNAPAATTRNTQQRSGRSTHAVECRHERLEHPKVQPGVRTGRKNVHGTMSASKVQVPQSLSAKQRN